jgi:hypothetical protein
MWDGLTASIELPIALREPAASVAARMPILAEFARLDCGSGA